MTLRARLIAGVGFMLLALFAAGTVVALRHRTQLVGQLDRQLASLTTNAQRLASRPAFGSFPGGAPGLADVYVGNVGRDGRLQTLLAPSNDPDLVPAHSAAMIAGQARTVPTLSGTAKRVRMLTTTGADGQQVVIATSTAAVENSFRSLLATEAAAGVAVLAVLALVVWWVQRLGLRPIRDMTVVADAIIAGETSRRVTVRASDTEAARLGRAMNVMLDTNQQSQDRLRRFVADASHELRTPLTTLRGYTALYERGGLADHADLNDAIGRIAGQAKRMTVLVDDLFMLAELDEQPALDIETVDVNRLLMDVANDARAVQPDRVITVDVQTVRSIDADSHRLTQAVAALMTNAMRYTPVDTPIELRATTNPNGWVRIEIIDHGPGITPEHQPHVFERFYRADRSRARNAGGTGLGLAIVAAIIDAHNGRYGVTTTPKGGATFHIELRGAAP